MENPNWLVKVRVQHHCTALLLPCCPTALLSCCPATLLPYCPAAATAATLSCSNTSRYIILVVAASPLCNSNSKSLRISVTLNSATYNCPCIKTGICKSTPTKLKDCPYDLFTVIAKHSQIGNCLLLTINSSSPSIKVSLM